MQARIFKHDALGTIRLVSTGRVAFVERDTRTARWGLRWLARRLAHREAAALQALEGVAHVPRLVSFDGVVLHRSFVPGEVLYARPPDSRRYFANALRVLRRMHRAGVTHNDLAKESNWIAGPGDTAGIVDFQIAIRASRRDARFRRLAYEDLRHLLKHKRTYRPDALTKRQRRVLARPGTGVRAWRALCKPLYRLVTRRVLRWPERRGPAERAV
jgi:RIO-like serine/threonine protein kinase